MASGMIDSQEVITFPPLRTGLVGVSLTYRILVNERTAEVSVSLAYTTNPGFVLARQIIPFADPKCIPKVVHIIENELLQQQFIDEYVPGGSFRDAIKLWVDEKGLRNGRSAVV